MNQKRRRRMTVRPSKGMITFSRVFGVVFSLIALAMLVNVLPMLFAGGFGGMGLVPVLMLLLFIGVGIFTACNKRGSYFMYEWELNEESDVPLDGDAPPSDTTEERLKKLQALYDQRLISTEEFEEKRKEILKEL